FRADEAVTFAEPVEPMNDISGRLLAGEAVSIDGVNLSLGRGAARVHILKGIDLHIARGDTVALLGPSGSGKSTLLMVRTGLERPDSGTVIVAGKNLLTLDEDRLARFRGRNIGIVFQAFHLIPTMTALENVAVPLELAGIADAKAIAERELAAVGLAQRAWHYPAELSGGDQFPLSSAGRRGMARRPCRAICLARSARRVTRLWRLHRLYRARRFGDCRGRFGRREPNRRHRQSRSRDPRRRPCTFAHSAR